MAAHVDDLRAAIESVSGAIGAVPASAFDWRPGEAEFSPKQIVAHLASANDFYVMIVDEARTTQFGDVRLHPGLAGWRSMQATDAAIAQCMTTLAALDCFERTYQRMLEVLDEIRPEELDRPFVFWRPDTAPSTTTLRQRVIGMAAEHMREHLPHLSRSLAEWHMIQTPSQIQG